MKDRTEIHFGGNYLTQSMLQGFDTIIVNSIKASIDKAINALREMNIAENKIKQQIFDVLTNVVSAPFIEPISAQRQDSDEPLDILQNELNAQTLCQKLKLFAVELTAVERTTGVGLHTHFFTQRNASRFFEHFPITYTPDAISETQQYVVNQTKLELIDHTLQKYKPDNVNLAQHDYSFERKVAQTKVDNFKKAYVWDKDSLKNEACKRASLVVASVIVAAATVMASMAIVLAGAPLAAAFGATVMTLAAIAIIAGFSMGILGVYSAFHGVGMASAAYQAKQKESRAIVAP